jgi:AmmeMemoRadiSam system protein A
MGPDDVDGTKLASLARYARERIRESLGGDKATAPTGPWTAEPAATFVTLRRGEALQGCVGTLERERPIAQDVSQNAIAAAFYDRRGERLELSDVDRLTVEISVLSRAEPIAFSSEDEALACLRPGEDGVLLRWHDRRATFLPQVWESLPDRADFLARLKEKAGLSADFWAPDMELSRYRVRKFVDAPTAARGQA